MFILFSIYNADNPANTLSIPNEVGNPSLQTRHAGGNPGMTIIPPPIIMMMMIIIFKLNL